MGLFVKPSVSWKSQLGLGPIVTAMFPFQAHITQSQAAESPLRWGHGMKNFFCVIHSEPDLPNNFVSLILSHIRKFTKWEFSVFFAQWEEWTKDVRKWRRNIDEGTKTWPRLWSWDGAAQRAKGHGLSDAALRQDDHCRRIFAYVTGLLV